MGIAGPGTARRCSTGPGGAGLGVAWLGTAGRGKAGQGWARQGYFALITFLKEQDNEEVDYLYRVVTVCFRL